MTHLFTYHQTAFKQGKVTRSEFHEISIFNVEKAQFILTF